jgi:hypothetical protein
MNGEHPPLPKPLHEAPFDFYLRRDRIDQDPIMKPVWANYVAELKEGKWLNILTDDNTHNHLLFERCPLPDDMVRSLEEDAEIKQQRIQKEAEENEERKRKSQRMRRKTTKPQPNKFIGVGLTANGVYCYANALFQILAHIPDFGITDLPISCQLGDLIRAIFTHQNTVPLSYVHSILTTMTTYYPALRWNLKEQQDPHELFLLLANKVYPAMGRLFALTMDHFANGQEVLRPETFLSLPIDTKTGINSAFRSEQKGAYGSVELRILQPPAVFMFQVKRFQQGTIQKDNSPIDLPMEINFERHMAIRAPNPYRLYATINHIGQYRTGGHYVAMINVNMSSLWFLFDDYRVSPVSKQADFDKLRSNAYLAFYVHTDLIGSLFPNSN